YKGKGSKTCFFLFFYDIIYVFICIRIRSVLTSVTPTSFVALCKILRCLFIHFSITLGFNIYGITLVYTSSSLAAAINNCLQTMTFFLAVLLRMEKLKLRTIGGVAKVAGIMLCMGGVATLAFYKGPYLKPFLHNYHPFDSNNNNQQEHDDSPGENWIKGCFLMLLSNLCWALWIVYQVHCFLLLLI
ncbi:WAT1-related protein, partial [Camellia lanceoleosa]